MQVCRCRSAEAGLQMRVSRSGSPDVGRWTFDRYLTASRRNRKQDRQQEVQRWHRADSSMESVFTFSGERFYKKLERARWRRAAALMSKRWSRNQLQNNCVVTFFSKCIKESWGETFRVSLPKDKVSETRQALGRNEEQCLDVSTETKRHK